MTVSLSAQAAAVQTLLDLGIYSLVKSRAVRESEAALLQRHLEAARDTLLAEANRADRSREYVAGVKAGRP